MLTRRRFCSQVLRAATAASAGACRRCWPGDDGAAARRPRQLLVRAANWLWSQQSEDGGWHSGTYGLLKSGQALTPFLLAALLDAPQDRSIRPTRAAVEFIVRHRNTDGALGLHDPDVLEYPNYATADALRCLTRVIHPRQRDVTAKMAVYLNGQQYREETGYEVSHPAFGGWGFGGQRPSGQPGHMDLAHTRRVLQALRASGLPSPEVLRRAESFLRVVQKHPDAVPQQPSLTPFEQTEPLPVPYDGGFYFSPVVLQANKGREAMDGKRPYFRSYATATCDGLLALLAAGVPRDDERVTAAARWLREHPRLDYPEGIPRDYPEPWGGAVWFYHLAVRAEAYSALDWPGDWRSDIASLLVKEQRDDGSFANARSPLMKEDDPLLCTGLAVMALTHCLSGRES
jgi:hypothetical protein